ncbi:MAG TPA: hypothetical protein VF174_16085 [Micromonosporaceae bacterium]
MGSTILLASSLILSYTAWYSIMCAVAPFTRCRHCRNHPRGRDCRWCDGTRRRLRIGRRLYNHFRTEYHRGTR